MKPLKGVRIPVVLCGAPSAGSRNSVIPSEDRNPLLPAPGLFLPPAKKGQHTSLAPPTFSSAEIYFVQVSLIIFTSVTLKLPIASLLDAFSTCPSFFSSTFVSGLAVPVTVT